MQIIVTHLASYRLGGAVVTDALAIAADATGAPAPPRFFVPGFLPCGECGRCRRALVGACATALSPLRDLVAPREATRACDLPARFLTAVDEPMDAAALSSEAAAAAGLAAFALYALASANVMPGDLSLWIGTGPLSMAGASCARALGAHGLVIDDADPPSTGDTPGGHAQSQIAAETVGDGVHGNRKRVLFAAGSAPADWPLIAALAEPGATIVALGPLLRSLPSGLPTDARLLHLSVAHPDFVPEALAAIRRGDVAIPTTAGGPREEPASTAVAVFDLASGGALVRPV